MIRIKATRRALLALSVLVLAYSAVPRPARGQDALCPLAATKRVALVIGNSYSGELSVSGAEDARAMAGHLGQIGFSVLGPLIDAKAKGMTDALQTLRSCIADSEVVVFFFSGHGYQLDQTNYLVPAGSAIDPAHPEVSIKKVMRSLSGAPPSALKFVFLDACRTDAHLPLVDGRRLQDVAGWTEDLNLKQPSNAPRRTIIGYAAASGQKAASGSADGLSPYTIALLRWIREPGLGVLELFERVRDKVATDTNQKQSPTVGEFGEFPQDFSFQSAARIRLSIDEADDDLFVLLNGRVVRSRRGNNDAQTPLPLRAGDNELELLAYNQRSYRNGQSWEKTEGWSYAVRILDEAGKEIPCPDTDVGAPCLAGREETPFKDGPHHGQLFTVARAVLHVDPGSAALSYGRKPDLDVWNREARPEAQNQAVLYEQNVGDLVRQVLGDFVAAPLSRTFARVHGNRSLKPLVEECMTEPERLSDLSRSVLAFFTGSPRPFDAFTTGLVDCVGVPVWTAFEGP